MTSGNPGRIWAVRLADSAEDEAVAPLYNSRRMLRTSVYTSNMTADGNSSATYLKANQVCRKAVESSGEWMLKIARRFQPKTAVKKHQPFCLVLNYGGGLATLVLLDGHAMPTDVDSVPRIGIEVVVASVQSEESAALGEDRPDEYGILTPEDFIYEHLVEGHRAHPEGVRIYLHPTAADFGMQGSWQDATACEKKHMFQLATSKKDPFCVTRLERVEEDRRSRSLAPERLPRTPLPRVQFAAPSPAPATPNGKESVPEAPKEKESEPKATVEEKEAESELEEEPIGVVVVLPPPAPKKALAKKAVTKKASKEDKASSSSSKPAAKRKSKATTANEPTPAAKKSKKATTVVVAKPAAVAAKKVVVKPKEAAKKVAAAKPAQASPVTAKKVVAAKPKEAASRKAPLVKPKPPAKPKPPHLGQQPTDTGFTQEQIDLLNQAYETGEHEAGQTYVDEPDATAKPENSKNWRALDFSPRELILLQKAFRDSLTEGDLKMKVFTKSSGKKKYNQAEVKMAEAILVVCRKEARLLGESLAEEELSPETSAVTPRKLPTTEDIAPLPKPKSPAAAAATQTATPKDAPAKKVLTAEEFVALAKKPAQSIVAVAKEASAKKVRTADQVAASARKKAAKKAAKAAAAASPTKSATVAASPTKTATEGTKTKRKSESKSNGAEKENAKATATPPPTQKRKKAPAENEHARLLKKLKKQSSSTGRKKQSLPSTAQIHSPDSALRKFFM